MLIKNSIQTNWFNPGANRSRSLVLQALWVWGGKPSWLTNFGDKLDLEQHIDDMLPGPREGTVSRIWSSDQTWICTACSLWQDYHIPPQPPFSSVLKPSSGNVSISHGTHTRSSLCQILIQSQGQVCWELPCPPGGAGCFKDERGNLAGSVVEDVAGEAGRDSG